MMGLKRPVRDYFERRQLEARVYDIVVPTVAVCFLVAVGYLAWTWVAHIHACP